ncbi:DUF4274 domain-containing protein [Paenibacillus sp. VCA1]|uniref:DUF4274 domain-containing protein n=1 Tax=Paenibacillus sp. VCA1 TaxID=3039148 RepID=UPI002870DD8B|nr:DUF4274 domain-containing protein [Paenibacillus sp. VCA1]MDR9855059.1 DUF4274 domain-containing protein [Paenibacillus sp. VCA1]
MDAVRLAAERLDPNERDARGRTPLMLCITNRMPPEGIRLLLEKGSDLEAEDKLGDTALKKAVKFKQTETVKLLLEFGAKLDSLHGMGTAWNAARLDKSMADLLLNTKGAVRLTLDKQERKIVDGILCLESLEDMCGRIRQLSSSVLLHAVLDGYNWDDGPEPMIAAFENPAIADITLLDMYELTDAEYWLGMDGDEWKISRKAADGANLPKDCGKKSRPRPHIELLGDVR